MFTTIRRRTAVLGAALGIAALVVGTVSAVPASASSAGGSISRSEVLSRAASWNGTPYSTTTYKAGPGGDISYRTDCSGFVSMALHLPTSYTTVTLPQVVTQIPKDSLQPGDLIGVLGPNTGGNAGHVLIFESWANSAHTSYNAWEDAGSNGVYNPTIPYPYWPNTSGPSPSLYQPYRYNNITGSTTTLPPWPNLVQGQTGANVLSAQYLLRDHGATIGADSQFGPSTEAAVEAFQTSDKLGVDGQIGPQTWSALIVPVSIDSNSDAVRAAQVQLNKYGYGLTVDGDFGSGTQTATVAFQNGHGLEPDGQIGPDTWQALVGGSS